MRVTSSMQSIGRGATSNNQLAPYMHFLFSQLQRAKQDEKNDPAGAAE